MYRADEIENETLSGQILPNTPPTRRWDLHILWTATLLFTLGCSSGGADMLDGGATGSATAVVVNEVYPHGSDPLTDPDWVELKNTGSAAVDVSGYRVRDSETTFALPTGTVIPPLGYLVLYCDDIPDGGASDRIHVPFKLGSADQVQFLDPTSVKIDGASWDATTAPSGKSFGRLPDGTGLFIALTKTLGARNI